MGKGHGLRASGLPPSAYDRPRQPPRGRRPRRAVAERQASSTPDRRMAGSVGRHGVRPHETHDHPPDDGRRDRRADRAQDQDRRSVAHGLGELQLPRLRPRRGDHRRGSRVPRELGHAPLLVEAPRQPTPLSGDRGAAHRAARHRRLARAPDDHAHPHVGDPGPGRATAPSSSTGGRTRRSTTGRWWPPATARPSCGSVTTTTLTSRRCSRRATLARRASSRWTASTR